jgi:ribonucleotide reductase beta subunit family protein with ferritin-like domain
VISFKLSSTFSLCRHAKQLYDHLHHRCTRDEVHDIVSEAVVIEKQFLTDALPCALIGINAGVSSVLLYNRNATNQYQS